MIPSVFLSTCWTQCTRVLSAEVFIAFYTSGAGFTVLSSWYRANPVGPGTILITLEADSLPWRCCGDGEHSILPSLDLHVLSSLDNGCMFSGMVDSSEFSSPKKWGRVRINSIVLYLWNLFFYFTVTVQNMWWGFIDWNSFGAHFWVSVSEICCSRTEKEKLAPFHPNIVIKMQPEPVKTKYIKDTC